MLMNACDLFVVSECMCKAGNAMGTHGNDGDFLVVNGNAMCLHVN